MRLFKVLPIKMSLKGNKFAKSRDIVSEIQLTSPAVELIAAGFIQEVTEVSEIETNEAEVVTLDTLDEIVEKPLVLEKKVVKDLKGPIKRK